MFEFAKLSYQKQWCSIEQLRLWVVPNGITEEQFKEITGEDY